MPVRPSIEDADFLKNYRTKGTNRRPLRRAWLHEYNLASAIAAPRRQQLSVSLVRFRDASAAVQFRQGEALLLESNAPVWQQNPPRPFP